MDSHPALSLEGNIQNTFVHIAESDLHEEGSRKRARSVPRSARLALPQDDCMIDERAVPTVGFSSNMLDAFSAAASEPPQECHAAELSVEDELCAKDREIENLRRLLRQAETANVELSGGALRPLALRPHRMAILCPGQMLVTAITKRRKIRSSPGQPLMKVGYNRIPLSKRRYKATGSLDVEILLACGSNATRHPSAIEATSGALRIGPTTGATSGLAIGGEHF